MAGRPRRPDRLTQGTPPRSRPRTEHPDPDLRRVTRRLRALVAATVGGVSERRYEHGKGFGRAFAYHDSHAGAFCGIMPHANHIRLSFAKGTALIDPRGLLQGTGARVRHVALRAGEEIPEDGIRALLEQAARIPKS